MQTDILPDLCSMRNRYENPGAARLQKGDVSEIVLSRYANVLTDSVFKKIFGSEQNKDMLITLIEEVLPGRKISEIKYSNTAHANDIPGKHDSIFDVECTDAITGERFDVEIQREKMPWYHERALFYSSFMIREQLEKGSQYYNYPPVYVISLLDYSYHEQAEGFQFRYDLRETATHKLMTDRLNFVFLELPNARQLDSPGIGILEKTCYALHNMTTFKDRPAELEGKFFEKLFELAEIAKFAPEERKNYERIMLTERDKRDLLAYAKLQGIEEGMEKGRAEGEKQAKLDTARNLLKLGVQMETVVLATGLSPEQLEALRKS